MSFEVSICEFQLTALIKHADYPIEDYGFELKQNCMSYYIQFNFENIEQKLNIWEGETVRKGSKVTSVEAISVKIFIYLKILHIMSKCQLNVKRFIYLTQQYESVI